MRPRSSASRRATWTRAPSIRQPRWPACEGGRAWVHVDGAFGLWRWPIPGSPPHGGPGGGDSWATDGHKWLNVPYDSGVALARDGAQLRAAMSASGCPILPRGRGATASPATSRRGVAAGRGVRSGRRFVARAGGRGGAGRRCWGTREPSRMSDKRRNPGAERGGAERGAVRSARPRPCACDRPAPGGGVRGRAGTVWQGWTAMRITSPAGPRPGRMRVRIQAIVRAAEEAGACGGADARSGSENRKDIGGEQDQVDDTDNNSVRPVP